MSDALRSARIKLDRANLHASTAKREFRRFINKHPRPTLRVESETDVQVIPVGETASLSLVLNRGFPALPDSFAARFGDALHNYRCALDHLAWELVQHGRDPNPAEPWRVQFPIYSERSKFRANRAKRLPGVDVRGPVQFIEARHRYVGGQATNEVLLRLARLSNEDKHRSLHLMFSAPSHARHQITFVDCRPVGFENPPERPKFVPDAEIARLTIVITGLNPTVEVKPGLTVYVSLEDWSNALDVLSETRAEVAEILNAPEIIAAVS
ncbi:MAG TPA: hypothetical protein VFB42_07220 [Gaiellaceae bacterium]|nr:hypothetical protein [Gaiellaceae bacterium]